MQSTPDLFTKQKFISLETFRKTGEGVRTPVWFAQDGSTLYVWTIGTSGKAKRIRRNPSVKVAPSTVNGTPLGEYVSGQAQVFTVDSPDYQRGNQLMDKKYGLQKKFFELFNRNNKANRTVIKIELS